MSSSGTFPRKRENQNSISGPSKRELRIYPAGIIRGSCYVLHTLLHCMAESSQIFRYGRSIFCLPHRPNFSDIFDLCLHWVSVVRGQIHTIGKFSGTFERSYLFYSQCSCHIHNELENLHKNRIQNSMDWHQDYTGLVCHLATGIFFRNVHLVSFLL